LGGTKCTRRPAKVEINKQNKTKNSEKVLLKQNKAILKFTYGSDGYL